MRGVYHCARENEEAVLSDSKSEDNESNVYHRGVTTFNDVAMWEW